MLIDMSKANPCLWDMYNTDYTNRVIKEITYMEIVTLLDTNIPSIKTKIKVLRVHLGRRMAKEKSNNNGQSTSKLYSTNWIHYYKLAFLVPVIGVSRNRDTLKRINLQEDESEKER